MGRTPHPSEPDEFAIVLDDIKDYGVLRVGEDGRIESWNVGSQRLEGYTPQEAIGQPFSMLFTREDVERGRPEYEMRVAREAGVYHGCGVRVRKDGTQFDAEVTLRRLEAGAGGLRGYLEVTRDISERTRAERLEKDRAEFEQQLIGIVSHDLRNPLNAILASAELLLRIGGKLNEGQTRALARIASSARRANRMVLDLLDFALVRSGSGLPVKRVPLRLGEFTQKVADEIRLAHPGRKLLLEVLGDDQGSWDPDRIAQVVINLVVNALKHGAQDAPVHVRVRGEGEAVMLEVNNRGAVISTETLSHLFDPVRIHRESETKNGSIGLGLYIVNHIIRAHEGTIEVRSSQEEGTTFAVRLPREPHVAPAPAPGAS